MSYSKTPCKSDAQPRYHIPMRPHPRTGNPEYCLEGEVRQHFIRLFPIHSNRRIMQWFGISYSTVQRLKRELSLEKNMTAIRREHARDVKKICEANGYYDSLRGHRPSEATIQGLRRLRAEGFDPITQLKRTNPRKYRAVIKQRSEKRKTLIQQERRRILYGLPRKTRLRVVLQPIGHIASSQKNSMITRNNYFADPDHPSWVCYDSLTRRSPRREATAVRHGLRIVAGEDESNTAQQ